ncbi:DUF134 domain-containing protein [Metallumcola ferriviriculae]|uniref:UPF0251 protein MFMK1_002711 n=1 Tax=Metallumcola ferriviriculae TaxID=3039180 RepID=A0AAU0UNH1_9FIRM|nr:DUF134 domain-containing protein [Desulfitibacteraceae bacterium MK1]
MPRPKKCRRVGNIPKEAYFKPAGIPIRELEEVNLLVEELEAIRLKDLTGLNQEECAQRMNVSRPTFQRILTKARQKIASALVDGKAIKVEGGDFRMHLQQSNCPKCRGDSAGEQDACPFCGHEK